MTHMNHLIYRAFVAALLVLGLTALVTAATVSASYVKTLGQTNAGDKFLLMTSGGRIAVDEQGNAYMGTPGGNSYLQKISPEGKILWQIMPNVPGFQGTAVDEKYLYTCGSGYYGRRQLQRWDRETGKPSEGWQYDWENGEKAIDGVRPPALPYALAVDGQYIFMADIHGNEIRRFNKVTGKEAPFPVRLSVVKPIDLAFTNTNTLLILTEEAVVEVDKEGKALRVPVIAGLRVPTAIDVSRKTGAIYVAEGGNDLELINRIRVYTPAGKPLNVEVGIGGEFSGKWYPLSFAFSGGAGDVALDPNGGLWVNGYAHRMVFCPILTHLTPGPEFKPDLTLRGVMGSGLAVDPELGVYVGASCKISWDDTLVWTAGLIDDGAAKLFPTTLHGWIINPVWSDGHAAIMAFVHSNVFHRVNAKNGALLGKSLASGTQSIAGTCVVGRDLFYTGNGRTIQRTTLDLDPPQPFMTLPEGVAPASGAIAVSPDQQLVYLSYAGETACYKRDGTQVWKMKCTMGTLYKGVLFTTNPDGPGIAALDPLTGKKLVAFGEKAEEGRPPIHYIRSMATGSKDGVDYLFIHSSAHVLVYRITIG